MTEKEKETSQRRGGGRRRVLAFIGDDEFKELVDKYGFSGAARKIEENRGIKVTKQTVRNEAGRRGILASKKDIKSGFHFEFFTERVLNVLGINAKWLGKSVGKGPDIGFKLNGEQYWVECKNWGFDRKIDVMMVKKMILSRFRDKSGRKFVIFPKKPEFTPKARKLLEKNGIEVIWIDDNDKGDSEALNWGNWSNYFRKGLKVLGGLFGRFVEIVDDIIDDARQWVYDLVWGILEGEFYEFYDQGGGQSRVKSGFKSILEGCGKVFGLVKGIGQNIGRNVGSIVSKFGKKTGWQAFVIDESGRFGLVGKVMGGENLKKEDENLEDLVDQLMNGVAALSNSIKELVESVKRYNNEIGRLAKVSKKIEKMNKEIRKGVQLIKKRYRSDELAKAALEGADMSEIIKKLDNIGKIRRLEKELRALEAKKDMTIKEVLQKALQGEMTIGELDRIQRAEAKKERLRREIAVLAGDANGSAGRKKKSSEYHLVKKM